MAIDVRESRAVASQSTEKVTEGIHLPHSHYDNPLSRSELDFSFVQMISRLKFQRCKCNKKMHLCGVCRDYTVKYVVFVIYVFIS